jgi:hypothetical protein
MPQVLPGAAVRPRVEFQALLCRAYGPLFSDKVRVAQAVGWPLFSLRLQSNDFVFDERWIRD